MRKDARNQALCLDRANGATFALLARRYGISRNCAFLIVKAQRRRQREPERVSVAHVAKLIGFNRDKTRYLLKSIPHRGRLPKAQVVALLHSRAAALQALADRFQGAANTLDSQDRARML
jgi:hypothetical protein